MASPLLSYSSHSFPRLLTWTIVFVALLNFCYSQEAIWKGPGPRSQSGSDKTGVYSLENGGESLLARLWLFQTAEKSIDIQYYSFAKDVTGLISTHYMVMAAERGVKVRLLVDDAASRMYSHQMELLDAHDNIEIRVYNAGLKLGKLHRRMKHLIRNRNRLLRRMHNKTFSADQIACISGGRNIADEYFDYDKKYNFRDRDVLLLGPVVKKVNFSFETFWSDSLTVLFSELSGRSKKPKKDSLRFARLHKKAEHCRDFPEEMKKRVDEFPALLAKAGQEKKFIWTDQVRFVSDIPVKTALKAREGNLTTDSVLHLLSRARRSVILQSPYFIFTEELQSVLRQAIERGVVIRLLTNSLASIDNHEAFGAYQKDRKKLIQTGVQVYEFKPDAAVRFKLMLPQMQEPLNYKPVYGFHSKSILIDDSVSIVGSYNTDPRSAFYNTECILIFRSPEFCRTLKAHLEEEFLPENAWPVSEDWNPDKKAGPVKRFRAFASRIIPKKLI